MKVNEIISKMTMQEKFILLTGKDNWSTVPMEQLGIPSIRVSDGPHGVRKVRDRSQEEKKLLEGVVTGVTWNEETLKGVCFPTASAIAATWNKDLARETGKALGKECVNLDIDVLLGPGTNIKRTPLCGRNFEYFSEDPLLAGELAAEYINGVQSQNVGTSLKHFAGNNQEFDRMNISSEIDERTMREIYLKPFEIAVKKAQPWTVMCAYNRFNGMYCSENKFLLDEVLKKEFGHKGIVVSDWWAVHDRAKALSASLELEMPFSDKSVGSLKNSYEKGEITDEEIDSAVERLLNFIFKAYDSRKKRDKSYDVEHQRKLAKEVALEAITLLKNEDNLLPINKGNVRNIAVIGDMAENPAIQGGGSSCVNAEHVVSPLEAIKDAAGADFNIEYSSAYRNWEHTSEVNGLNTAMEIAGKSDITLLFVGDTSQIEGESFDRTSIKLPAIFEKVILNIAEQNPNTVVVVQAGSAIDMSAWIDKVKAVVFSWFTGEEGGSALADILFGKVSPSGKIAETFPLKLEDTPAYGTYPGNGYASWYSEGIMVGYRYYDTYKKPVLFPFGYGLSYTTFEYSGIKVSADNIKEDDKLTITLKIRNTGSYAAKEIVQLYVRDIVTKVIRPYKELKAFEKVYLEPNEEKEINFVLEKDAFAYYNTTLKKWFVESGDFEILVGSSSRDIKASKRVNIQAKKNFS
ncbi:beta-glucosidase [Clostridium oryzae]|uniref:Thermostable beta-glucosidase B n=1 Tax=Clostridium oryzae TaxID=1450648 RepID=A0A1V4I8I0_9CLOT|nr:glycoside hydrolase family 3 C-terminal domain-containing protein [Clostridium oryzae]OPJ56180.1 thermostable beta-glucosidase B [Clostridium oryzae]